MPKRTKKTRKAPPRRQGQIHRIEADEGIRFAGKSGGGTGSKLYEQYGRPLEDLPPRWQGSRIKAVLDELFLSGAVPPRDRLSDSDLIRDVLAKMTERALHPLPHPDSILLEAGRKRRRPRKSR